ncbi:MAG: hypothetical protein LUI85_16195 [Bacteroides sp.]|nr:hypothetical protein [Bacteroides sp.]
MAKNKVILVDSDVISHFIATGNINRLTDILFPHALFIVENVYREATFHPTDSKRKQKVDEWIHNYPVCRVSFPSYNMNIFKEFYRLKKESPLLGDGERACMSIARFGHEVIASSNFRDVADYCNTNGIEYIGTLDILVIAMQKGIYTEIECNHFIAEAIRLNDARFPVVDITRYQHRDLTEF